jgi:hypothetical protein
MLSVKTFEDKYNSNKKFHHVNLLGLKFRIANNERGHRVSNTLFYKTNRGIVFNGLENRYLCLITK